MLTIKKIENLTEANSYLESKQINHDLTGEQAMGLFTDSGLSAIGSLSLVSGKVYLNFIYVEDESWDMTYGLAKSLLNMADLRGIQTIYGNNHELDKLYTALRFIKKDGEAVLSLSEYFSPGSDC